MHMRTKKEVLVSCQGHGRQLIKTSPYVMPGHRRVMKMVNQNNDIPVVGSVTLE